MAESTDSAQMALGGMMSGGISQVLPTDITASSDTVQLSIPTTVNRCVMFTMRPRVIQDPASAAGGGGGGGGVQGNQRMLLGVG